MNQIHTVFSKNLMHPVDFVAAKMSGSSKVLFDLWNKEMIGIMDQRLLSHLYHRSKVAPWFFCRVSDNEITFSRQREGQTHGFQFLSSPRLLMVIKVMLYAQSFVRKNID